MLELDCLIKIVSDLKSVLLPKTRYFMVKIMSNLVFSKANSKTFTGWKETITKL